MPHHEDELDKEMQIPCEQGGVCPHVPIWGGAGMPAIEGHLKAFSTDFWVWSKFQRPANPAQQTKYFSTNQQAYERPDEKSSSSNSTASQ